MLVITWKWFPKSIDGFGGIWPFVLVRWDAEHLIEHEKVHNRQCLRGLFLVFWLRYLFSKKARYLFELEAYRVSVAHGAEFHSVSQTLYRHHAKRAGISLFQVVEDLGRS